MGNTLEAGDRNAHAMHAQAHDRATYVAVYTRTVGLKDSLDTTAKTEITQQITTEGNCTPGVISDEHQPFTADQKISI